VNLLDSNAVAMKQKFQFDKAPTELGLHDYGIFPNHMLLNMGRDLNEMEKQMRKGAKAGEKKQRLIEQALQ
jgi:hypothetical protein